MPCLAEHSGIYLSQFTTELLWILWHLAGFPRCLSYSGKFFFLGLWLYCRHQSLTMSSLAIRSVRTLIAWLFWGTIACGSGKNIIQ